MSNVTISMDSNLLKAGRNYARLHKTTLNNLVRKLLKQTVEKKSENWLDECFAIMDKAQGNSKGAKWKREDLYNV
jgi:ribonuclease D